MLHQQQGQLTFIQSRVSPQGQPVRQQRHLSPLMQNFNPSAQPFIPAAEAQQNPVPNTQEPRIPKSADGQGVKKQLNNRQGLFLMQTNRSSQKGLSRATPLLQM